MTRDFLSNVEERKVIIRQLTIFLRKGNYEFLLAAQPRDVSLASMVALETGLPLTYFDHETKALSLTEGLWGKKGVLLADRIDSIDVVEPTILMATSNGGVVRNALLLVRPNKSVENDLGRIGIVVEVIP